MAAPARYLFDVDFAARDSEPDEELPTIDLVAHEPLAEIEALVAECLGPLRHTPHLVIRLNDAHVEALRAHVDRLAYEKGFEGRLVILGEPDFAVGDCRIEWADGGIVRDTAEVEATISAALERYLAARAAGRPSDTAQAPTANGRTARRQGDDR
ncbi:MAG TPA: FliH/SctL family protein [Kaistiaceae bacterium]|nr:FliH/SctL family protein [Kaistiaceae bacterium]